MSRFWKRKSEKGKENWWPDQDSRAEIKGGLQKIPFEFSQGFWIQIKKFK
jgi:hypothetical protein